MGRKLNQWYIYNWWYVLPIWRKFTGKKSMKGWCTGDCLSHPINWNYDPCPWDDCMYPMCNVKMGCPPSAFQTEEYKDFRRRELK